MKSFADEGVAVIDAGVPSATLDAAARDARALLSEVPANDRGVQRLPDRVMDGWRLSDAIRAVALSGAVLDALEQIVGPRPRAFQTLNFEVGSEQHVHADAYHFDSWPSGRMCGVWVALEDVDPSSGPLVYYPGSHRLPGVAAAPPGAGSDAEDAYHRHLDDLLARSGVTPREATLRKGDALVWAANLVHGGAPRRDPARTRRSQVTHYLVDGARCWVPKRSASGEVRWRTPEWVG